MTIQTMAVELTQRQHEIYELLRQGLKNSEIAAKLYVEPSTIKSHLRSLYRDLGVTNRTSLVAFLSDSEIAVVNKRTKL